MVFSNIHAHISRGALLSATNGGSDIIKYLYPETSDHFGSGKNFKSPLREGDSNPSASLKEYDGIWYLTDFALGSKGMNGIDLYMQAHNCDFPTALRQLAEIFNLTESDGKLNYMGPKIEKRKALDGQNDGKYLYYKNFTKEELAFLAPGATDNILEMLHFKSVERIAIVKDGNELNIISTPFYPIFAREANMINKDGEVINTVHKIYQPRYRQQEGQPSRKFSYQETGKNPDTIVNGLYEIHQARERGEKHIKAVICCGERDAVSCMTNGYYPIWFNGEGHVITPYEMKLIRDAVDDLWYVPDIDGPGKAAGRRNMKSFPDLRIVWLPNDMLRARSDQNKACKDLRDWINHNRKHEDFVNLLKTSHCYKITNYGKNGAITVSPDNLRFMLAENGYFQYFDKISNSFILVHKDGKRIRQVTKEEVRNFIVKETEKGYTPAERDKILSSKALDNNLKDLKPIELDFTSATKDSQIFFCQNTAFLINAEGISEISDDHWKHVWDEKLFKHDVKVGGWMFEFHKEPNPYNPQMPYYPVTFKEGCNCKAAHFIERLSRIHWYKQEHGEELTDKEKYENNMNLQAMMYAIGHLMHRYNRKSSSFAPYLFEYERYDGVECNGGTGKSTLLELIKKMGYKIVEIKLLDPEKELKSQFAFQMVDIRTDIIFFDEFPEHAKLKTLNDIITGGLQVEKKNKDRYQIPFEDSARIAIASNYDPDSLDPSITRRVNAIPVGHYYHVASENTPFENTRTIADDFGMDMWQNDYTEEDWNLDANFMMQCLYFYFSVNKNESTWIKAPLDYVYARINANASAGTIDEWARLYFTDTQGNINCEIPYDAAFNNYNSYRREKGYKEVTKNAFKRSLKAWLANRDDMEFNPMDICTDKGTQRIKRNNIEYIYVRTKNPNEQILPF